LIFETIKNKLLKLDFLAKDGLIFWRTKMGMSYDNHIKFTNAIHAVKFQQMTGLKLIKCSLLPNVFRTEYYFEYGSNAFVEDKYYKLLKRFDDYYYFNILDADHSICGISKFKGIEKLYDQIESEHIFNSIFIYQYTDFNNKLDFSHITGEDY
jgi:hypothetical protein